MENIKITVLIQSSLKYLEDNPTDLLSFQGKSVWAYV